MIHTQLKDFTSSLCLGPFVRKKTEKVAVCCLLPRALGSPTRLTGPTLSRRWLARDALFRPTNSSLSLSPLCLLSPPSSRLHRAAMLWPRPSFPPAAQAAVRRTPAQASTSSFHGGPGRGGPIFRLHARRPRADLVVVASSSSSASSSFAYVPLAAYPCHHLAHSIRRKRRPTDEDKEEPSRHPDAPPEVSDGGRQALDLFLDRRILQLAQLEFPPDSVSSVSQSLFRVMLRLGRQEDKVADGSSHVPLFHLLRSLLFLSPSSLPIRSDRGQRV